MTANQLRYQELKELHRANLEKEKLTSAQAERTALESQLTKENIKDTRLRRIASGVARYAGISPKDAATGGKMVAGLLGS